MLEVERDVVPENISIEFERDAAIRAVRIVVFNMGRQDEYSCELICSDNGKIAVAGIRVEPK